MIELLNKNNIDIAELFEFNRTRKIILYKNVDFHGFNISSNEIAGIALEDGIDGYVAIDNGSTLSFKSFPLVDSDISFINQNQFILRAVNLDNCIGSAFEVKRAICKVNSWILSSVSATVSSKDTKNIFHRNETGSFIWRHSQQMNICCRISDSNDDADSSPVYRYVNSGQISEVLVEKEQMVFIPAGIDYSVLSGEEEVFYSVELIDLNFREIFVKIASEIMLKNPNLDSAINFDNKKISGVSSLSEAVFSNMANYFSKDNIEKGLCEYLSSGPLRDGGMDVLDVDGPLFDGASVPSLSRNVESFLTPIFSERTGSIYCNGESLYVGSYSVILDKILNTDTLSKNFIRDLSQSHRDLVAFLFSHGYFLISDSEL